MKVIDFNDWKKNKEEKEHHLKIKKEFVDINDFEVRLLLEEIVDRLNFSVDQLYKSYQLHKETFEIIDTLSKNQSNLKHTQDALSSLTKKTSEALFEQARIVKILMEK